MPPIIAVSATGAAAQMVVQFEDALNSGAPMEEACVAANPGALAGLSEAVPIARLFEYGVPEENWPADMLEGWRRKQQSKQR